MKCFKGTLLNFFLDMVLIRFSRELTLPVLCLASLSRSIVGVAGGATKAAVAQHQVRGIHYSITFSKTYYLKLVVNKSE